MEYELEGFEELDLGMDISIPSPSPVQNIKKSLPVMDKQIVSKARALYISQNMSIPKIANALGVSEHTLSDYCRKQKWTLYRTNPDLELWTGEMFDEIYDNIDFYDRAKELLASMIEVDAFQTPKDIKAIIEAFKLSEERTGALRLIKENAGELNVD